MSDLVTDRGPVTFTYYARGIQSIVLADGTDLTGPNGGWWVIGSYGGVDDSATNLSSTNDGEYLATPQGAVKGAPYRIGYRRLDWYTLEVTLDVGPLEQPYESLSLPLAVRRDLFTHYQSPAAEHYHGAGDQWTRVPGGGGTYAGIPLLVPVYDLGVEVGLVGAARMLGALPWGDCAYAGCAIRRRIMGSTLREWAYVNHPHSFTNEPSVSGDMSMNPPLPAGFRLHHVEHLIVTPAARPPRPPTGGPMSKVRIRIPAIDVEVEAGATVPIPATLTVVGAGVEPPIEPPVEPGPGPDPSVQHPTFRANPFLGYAPVNTWPWLDPVAAVDACYTAGLTLVLLEYVSWWPNLETASMTGYGNYGKTDTLYPEQLKAWAAQCRKRDITLAIVIANWNSAAIKAKPTSWARDQVNWIKGNLGNPHDTLYSGRPALILEGVSEPDASAAAKSFCQTVKDTWGGPFLGNGVGGRNAAIVSGNWTDWHHCAQPDFFNSPKPNSYLNNTDCGGFPPNPGAECAGRMARKSLDVNTCTLIYGFADQGTDFPLIAAMGVEVQKGGPATYRYTPAGATPPPTTGGGAPAPGQPPKGTKLEGTTLIVCDLVDIPSQIKAEGLGTQHRDSIHWYALSRSYAAWQWEAEANKLGCPDMWAANVDIRNWFAARLAQSMTWVRADPARSARLVINDAKDRHGQFLVREMVHNVPADLAGRVHPGGPFLPIE